MIKACKKLPCLILFLLKRIWACCAFSLVCGGDPGRPCWALQLASLSRSYFPTDLEEPAADSAACCFQLLESLSCCPGFLNYVTGLQSGKGILLTLELFVMRLSARFDRAVDFKRFVERSVVNLKFLESIFLSEFEPRSTFLLVIKQARSDVPRAPRPRYNYCALGRSFP